MTTSPSSETAKEAARRLAAHQIREGFVPDGLHTYTDARGQELYRRIRARHPSTGEKWIRPMHRSGSRYELGEPSFPSGKKPLYNLYGIATADPAQPVWFVEGEKCADALIKLGLVATTAGGSTSDESADFDPLRDRPVICWPDNDTPGREHIVRVATKLRSVGSTVESIDIARLALPAKGDVLDYLRLQPASTAADLMALVRVSVTSVKSTIDPEGPRLELVRSDTVKLEPVRWLWNGFLPEGMLVILAGAPGTGKTTIALSLAATISVGGAWPDGSLCGKVGDVLIWSGEDVHAVLRARLQASGANLERMHFVGDVVGGDHQVVFDPARDFNLLETAAAGLSEPRLLIIDPVVSSIPCDSNRNAEVRRALQPLVALANRTGCAVLGITHFSKGTAGRDPVERINGSIAFAAAARLVLVTAKVKRSDEGRRVFLRAKSNIGPDDSGFAYTLERVELTREVEGQRVRWIEPIHGTAQEILADADIEANADGDSPGDVEAFVRRCLAGGPAPALAVEREARDAGYSWDRVKRASKRIGVAKHKDGMQGGWLWEMPEEGRNVEGSEGSRQSGSRSSVPIWNPAESTEESTREGLLPSRSSPVLRSSAKSADKRDDDLGADPLTDAEVF